MVEREGNEIEATPKTLAAKLEDIVRDLDLNMALGVTLEYIVIPGLITSRQLTEEEAERILEISAETIDASLTPEQRHQAAKLFKMRSKEPYGKQFYPGALRSHI